MMSSSRARALGSAQRQGSRVALTLAVVVLATAAAGGFCACRAFDASEGKPTEAFDGGPGPGPGPGPALASDAATDGASTCATGRTVAPESVGINKISGSAVCFSPDGGTWPVLLGVGLNAQILGDNVNGCLKVRFGAPLQRVEIVGAGTAELCGVTCTSPPDCSTEVRVFSVDEAETYLLLQQFVATAAGPRAYAVEIARDVRTVVICRGVTANGAAFEMTDVRGICR